MLSAPSRTQLLATMIATGAVGTAQAQVRPVKLRCEYLVNPLAVETQHPRLFWQLEGDGRDLLQAAYQVIVASTPEKLAGDQGDLWDSGRVESGDSIQIRYQGVPLLSGQLVHWKVRCWDQAGRVAVSEPASWAMGLLSQDDWTGDWIGYRPPAGERPPSLEGGQWVWHAEEGSPPATRYFRGRVELAAAPEAAELTIACDDQYTLWLNGAEIGASDGQADAWRRPQVFELTDSLRAGVNVLAVAGVNVGMSPAALAGHLRLRIGGETVSHRIDGAWRSSADEAAGWQAPEFDDSAWSPVRIVATVRDTPWGVPEPGTGAVLPPAPYLRREFALDAAPTRATLYVAALGVVELQLNGQRIGDEYFAAGWTDYRLRIPYRAYDVTDQVAAGDNALGAILGEGWYSGYCGIHGREHYGSQPWLKAQLVIESPGGTSVVVTDGEWRASYGPIREADMLMGEAYDARLELGDWAVAGFDADDWDAVQVGPATEAPLQAHRGVPVRVTEELTPRSVSEPSPGVFVYDLGQNLVGWVRLRVRGGAGTQVRLRFAEMLQPDGNLYTTNLRSARCTDFYTCKGAGEEVWEPRFTFHGFRYVELTGYPGAPPLEAITGIVAHSDTPPAGRFECDNEMVNQLYSNIVWGQRGNFLEVPTDCPQRDERQGWMGDAQVFIRAACFNMDVAGFFTQWLVNVADAQDEQGAMPDTAPRIPPFLGKGTAAWGDAGVICPWVIYQVYGDAAVLAEHYQAMASWVEYCRNHSTGLLRPSQGYGDWLSIRADTPKDVLATAYFAHSADLVSRAAGVLGRADDATKYRRLFEEIRDAFNEAYVAEDGRIKGDTQTCYVLALHMNLLSEAHRAKAIEYLCADIEARDGHLSTGFVGTAHLMPVLSRFGRTDMAYRLLLNETFPSWGYSIAHGATTIWERWDGWTADRGFQDPGMNSFNHYSFGAVGQWLFETVCGIKLDPAMVGDGAFLIAPEPGGGLTRASASYDSVYGEVATSWALRDGRFHLTVTIPPNCTALVTVPTSDPASVTLDGGAAGGAKLELGSGRYEIIAAE